MVGSVSQSFLDPRTLITNRLSAAFNSLSTVLELVWASMRMVEQGPQSWTLHAERRVQLRAVVEF